LKLKSIIGGINIELGTNWESTKKMPTSGTIGIWIIEIYRALPENTIGISPGKNIWISLGTIFNQLWRNIGGLHPQNR
jgi:hypothetical protein